jgi:hypothetical protein
MEWFGTVNLLIQKFRSIDNFVDNIVIPNSSDLNGNNDKEEDETETETIDGDLNTN